MAASAGGAADTVRHKAGMPASPPDAAMLEHFLAPARAAITADEWETELDAGRILTYEQAVALLTGGG